MGLTVKYIDLASIIENSNSSFLKRLPRFVVRLVQRIIMEDEMNRIMTKYANVIGNDFLFAMLKEFNITVELEGKENLPDNGRCFFIANHPFGVIDGLVLTSTIVEKYGNFKAIGNEAFMFIPNMRPLIAAVNVFKPNSKEYISALEQVFDSDIAITHFPSGEVSRLYHWRIQDCAWQKSFIYKSSSKNRDVVPFYFYGRNSLLFYTIGIVRKLLGIKINIELMLLPREMFRKKNKTIRGKIGKPIPATTFDKSHTHQEWAGKLRDYLYRMGKSRETITFNA
jgi:putative hemolysin